MTRGPRAGPRSPRLTPKEEGWQLNGDSQDPFVILEAFKKIVSEVTIPGRHLQEACNSE